MRTMIVLSAFLFLSACGSSAPTTASSPAVAAVEAVPVTTVTVHLRRLFVSPEGGSYGVTFEIAGLTDPAADFSAVAYPSDGPSPGIWAYRRLSDRTRCVLFLWGADEATVTIPGVQIGPVSVENVEMAPEGVFAMDWETK